MSITIMTAIWKYAPYSENKLLVLLALADWSDDDGYCFPSMEQLAHKARIDRRSARRILRTLESDTFVRVILGAGRKSTTGSNTNRYQINLDKLAEIRKRTELPPLAKEDTADTQRGTLAPAKGDIANSRRGTPASPDPSLEPSDLEPSEDPPYRSTDFLSALRAFENSRKNMKKPLTAEARRLLYKKLRGWSEQTATEALENSVMNRWQGVFEPRRNGNAESNRPNDTNSSFEFTPQSRIT